MKSQHSDELSIFYFAHGREIIVEAGPNGYEYTDPLTRYAFSSAAHNTMLVDGEGLPRTDKRADQTTLQDSGTSLRSLDVTGRTSRYEGVHWSRRVKVGHEESGRLVSVRDEVRAEEERTFTFLWHLAHGLRSVVRGNALEIFDEVDQKIAEVVWRGSIPTAVRTVSGQRSPETKGWAFPQMGTARPAEVLEVEFRGTSLDLDWEIRSSEFTLVDRGLSPGSTWQCFQAEKPVNYLLEGTEPQEEVNRLVVAFTAMGKVNDFTFNYRASLEKFPGAQLYILDDFGDQGAYYLASNRNLAEFRSVQALIKSIANDLGLNLQDVIMVGSSKGATAAILHGAALGVGHVYAGAPQYRIGNFVRNPHPNVLEYVAGGSEKGDVSWLNQIATRLLESGVRSTPITVVVGRKDGHHRHHVVPLIDELRMLGYSPENLVLPGTTHDEFGAVYRWFLSSLVRVLDPADEVAFANTAAVDVETGEVGLVVSGVGLDPVQAQLYRGKERIGKLQRLRTGHATWKVTRGGTYRARVYFNDPGSGERKAFPAASVSVQLNE